MGYTVFPSHFSSSTPVPPRVPTGSKTSFIGGAKKVKTMLATDGGHYMIELSS